MNIELKLISANETYDLRHKILRPNQDREACHYDCDKIDSTFHVGANFNDEIVGIATFFKEVHEDFTHLQNHYRLRGMATDIEFRGTGLGKKILSYGIEELICRNSQMIWCNARTSAIGFYQSQGFEIHGQEFEIVPIGPHFIAYKEL